MGYDDESNESILSELSTETPAATPEAQAPVSTEPSKPQTYKYSANGKEIEEPLEMILKRASQGYNYSQRMADVNRQMAEFEKIKSANQSLEKWKQYDEYAQKNPKWNEHVQQMWEARESALNGQEAQDVDPKILAMIEARIEKKYGEKFQKYDQHFEVTEKERALEKTYMEDQELDEEITKVRSSHPDIDFDKTDEQGVSFEKQVCNFGAKEGIKTFTSAFRAYHHDQLLLREREKAKEEFQKNEAEQKKKGIIGKSQSPLMNGKDNSYAKNVRSRSYDELAREAIDEISQ